MKRYNATEAEEWLAERGFVTDVDWFSRSSRPRAAALCVDMVHQFRLRDEYIPKFGFAIPDRAAIEVLKHYAPLVEVGAGSGYWSYELLKAGVDVIATEPGTGQYRVFREPDVSCLRIGGGKGVQQILKPSVLADEVPVEFGFWKPWTQLKKLTATKAVAKYPTRNLLTVWPDYNVKWPLNALKAFTGEYVCYVGEFGGCTGSQEFHDYLSSHFEEVEDVSIPQFQCIHDRLYVYRRKHEE
jgi:hypothetical protein